MRSERTEIFLATHKLSLVLTALTCMPTLAMAWTAQPLGYTDNNYGTGFDFYGHVILYDTPTADILAIMNKAGYILQDLELNWWNGIYQGDYGYWYALFHEPNYPDKPLETFSYGYCGANGSLGAEGLCHYPSPPTCAAGQVSTAAGQCVDRIQRLNVGQPPYCVGGGLSDPITGNVYQVQTDYVSNSVDPLRFVRYYNSSANGAQQHVTGIGTQWRHTYMRSIHDASTTTVIAAGVHRPDGRILYFTFANGEWVPNADITAKLQQDSASGAWTYTSTNDDVEHYDATGRLRSITDARGDIRTLTYDHKNRITMVEDSFGNSITFAYDAYNRIQSISDRASRSWTYHYDSSNNIASVDNPDGTSRQYHYNEQAYTENANLPHALTGITDERGVRYATFEYYADGRIKATYHPMQTTDGEVDAGKVTTTYDDVNNARTVTDSRNNRTTYATTTQLGVDLPSQITGPSCGCGGP